MKVRSPRLLSAWIAVVALVATMSVTLVGIAQPSASPIPPAAPPPPFLRTGITVDAFRVAMRERASRVRLAGRTSILFKASFSRGVDAAIRPRTRSQGRGFLSDIAAYRMSILLGMDNVPPTIFRRFQRSELDRISTADEDELPDLIDAILWDADGETARSAATYWVPELRDAGLDTPAGRARIEAWLSQSRELSRDNTERSLASDISTMIAFDFVIANADRWSGENVRVDASGARVVVRDHNLAFAAGIPAAKIDEVFARVTRVERFSRSFVTALAALDREKIVAELARDPGISDQTVLTDRQIADILDRRVAVLSHIGALIAEYGRERVLAFP